MMTTTSEHKRDGNHGEDAGQDHRNFDGVRGHVSSSALEGVRGVIPPEFLTTQQKPR
jgi:hypothetical protein